MASTEVAETGIPIAADRPARVRVAEQASDDPDEIDRGGTDTGVGDAAAAARVINWIGSAGLSRSGSSTIWARSMMTGVRAGTGIRVGEERLFSRGSLVPVSADQLMLTDRSRCDRRRPGHRRGNGAGARAARRPHCVCDRQADGLAETAAAIEATGRRVLADVFDVCDAESVESFMARVAGELGLIDIRSTMLAVVSTPSSAACHQRRGGAYRRELRHVTNSVRSALDRLADGAAIVNVTSVESTTPPPASGSTPP